MCRRRPREQRWVEWDSGCVRFHVTFYHIQASREDMQAFPWRHGPLHSDPKNRILCESVYTVSPRSGNTSPEGQALTS